MSEAAATADLLWQAAIQDKTGPFFRKFDNNLNRLDRRSEEAMNNFDKYAKKPNWALDVLTGAITGITMKLLAMGTQAVRQFTSLVKGSVQVAARAQTLAVSLRRVGENAGYSAEEMREYEEAMKAKGITTIKTREALLKMAQAELDLSKASDLARVAQNAAVIAGTNSSEAFGRIIHGITTLNPLILRNMGIVVNLQEEYKALAKQMGVENAQQLDVNTKQQVALNAVMKAGERIFGTYESAMETAGKQAGSLARHQEELALAMGNAMQPAYLEWIQFMTRELKEARAWFEENADAVEEFGRKLGLFVREATELLGGLLEQLTKVPTLVADIGEDLAIIIGGLDEAEAQARRSELGTIAAQLITFVAGFLATGIKTITEGVAILYDLTVSGFKAIGMALRTPITEWHTLKKEFGKIPEMEDAVERVSKFGDTVVNTMRETVESVGTMTGLFEELKEEAEEAAPAIDEAALALARLEEETQSAIDAITELNDKFAKELAAIAKREFRDRVMRELRESHRREDIERNHQKRVEKILKDAENRKRKIQEDAADQERKLLDDQLEERGDLERDFQQDSIDAEIEYRRELQRIQQDFDDEAGELARRNDAVGLARLMRTTARRLRDAEQSKAEEREDRKRDYNRDLEELRISQAKEREAIQESMRERMEDFQNDLAERLAQAEEARQESYENLERSLERERQIRALQRQWEEEDRMEKHQTELSQLGAHLATLEMLDQASLEKLLAQHGQYIQDDLTLWAAYHAAREQQAVAVRGERVGGLEREAARELMGLGITPMRNPARTGATSDEWRYAQGGAGLAMHPQNVRIAEEGPEAIFALPLNRSTSHTFRGDMSVNINGVSPSTEAELKPILFDVLVQMAIEMKSSYAGGM